ncbi:MAG: hypothetical protein JSW68_04970 [Burkholderiales bacterium]|nr:MAG: hypothetical protein JSW68_04970 [Burkholderiales bacterium]
MNSRQGHGPTGLPAGARERGAIAASFAVMVVLLLGFVALGLDAGRLFVSKTELQNAADACALAAVAEIAGANSNQLGLATGYGIAAGTRNLAGMQSTAVSIAPGDVTFSTSISGPWQSAAAIGTGAAALTMRYVRCVVSESGIEPLMIRVLNAVPGVSIGTQTVDAFAVASSTEPAVTVCALPLAVCNVNSGDPDFGYSVGEWIQAQLPSGTATTGTFRWAEFYDANNNPLADQNKDLEDLLTESGECKISTATRVKSAQGEINSLKDGWNTRFGLMKNVGDPAVTIPDYSGCWYDGSNWDIAAGNAFHGEFVLAGGICNRSANTPAQAIGQGYSPLTSAQHLQYGGNRRVEIVPVVDCGAFDDNPSQIIDIDGWACIFMLNPMTGPTDPIFLEYLGEAGATGSPCRGTGRPGGGSGSPLGDVPALVQ